MIRLAANQSAPILRRADCSSTRFLGCGLPLPARVRFNVVADLWVSLIRTRTGKRLNAGNFLVSQSSRRGSGYSVYTACAE